MICPLYKRVTLNNVIKKINKNSFNRDLLSYEIAPEFKYFHYSITLIGMDPPFGCQFNTFSN